MSASKITPAMRAWCRRLVDQKGCTLRRSKHGSLSTSGWDGHGKPTHVMVDKLESAGLVEFKAAGEQGILAGDQIAHLTEAGKAACDGN